MRKVAFTIIIVNLIVAILVIVVNRETIETITYFPLDPEVTIEQSGTSLDVQPLDNKRELLLYWDVQSATIDPLYLRQDVSLLFENGYLLALTNEWETETDKIQTSHNFKRKGNKLFQSISFHYGEIHQNDRITSTQHMTSDQLYAFSVDDDSKTITFKVPDDKTEEHIAHSLNERINERLSTYWNHLIDEYNIDANKYLLIPLVDLAKYNDESLPNLSPSETQKAIGQLWEGLYKNYVVPLSNQKHSSEKNYMPLILFDQQAKHLIVIFKINGKTEQLYQNIT